MTEKTAQKLEDRPQYYAEHLSQVNKSAEVVSTEDIYNERGVLVAKKGARISESVSAKLLEHKLAKPLHDSVNIRNGLKEERLLDHYGLLYERYPDLKVVLDGNELRDEFEDMVRGVALPPSFLQNLTVLELRAPETFEKALFCALLSSVIARGLGLHATQVRAAYLAGLVHDIGLLHIDPQALNKREALSAEEWRAVQSHVVVGQLLVQSVSHRVPPLTARAVLEHHERCDGSGYPTAHTQEDLHVLGQIVGLADSLEAIRVNQFERQGLNLANAVPYLQMNQTTHFYEVYQTTRQLLRRSGLKEVLFNPEESVQVFGQRLINRSQGLETALPALEKLHEVISGLSTSRRFRSLSYIPERVITMIHASGLLREELVQWLRQVAERNTTDSLQELDHIELLQNELQWQLGSVRRTLNEFLEKGIAQSRPEHALLTKLLTALDTSGDALRK